MGRTQMGSISDNTSGNTYSYRASKAALNISCAAHHFTVLLGRACWAESPDHACAVLLARARSCLPQTKTNAGWLPWHHSMSSHVISLLLHAHPCMHLPGPALGLGSQRSACNSMRMSWRTLGTQSACRMKA